MTATKIQPGNETHLTLLMAPHSLNFVTGADRAALLAYGRDVFAAGREAKCLTQIQGPADMRNALRWAAGGLQAVADDNETLRIGSETRTVGEVLDAANAALEPAAPALEAPAAHQQGFRPGKPGAEVEVAWLMVRSLVGDGEGATDEADTVVLALRGDDEQWLVAGDWRANSTLDSVHEDGGWIVGWMPYEVPAARLAAAPQAPAAHAAIPPSAITASLMRDDGGEAPAYCLMVAYRSERDARAALSLLSAAPAAPAVDALEEARRTVAAIGIVGHYNEQDVILRSSVLGMLDRRIAEACAAAAQAKEGGVAA